MATELVEQSVIQFPVPVSDAYPDGIFEIPIEVDGINAKRDPKWIIPDSWKEKHPKLGTYMLREYSIDVDPRTAKYLRKNKFPVEQYGADVEDRKQQFIDVVKAYNDYYNKTGLMEGKVYDMDAIPELGKVQTQNKYINMAKALGLFTTRGKKTRAQRAPSKTEEKLQAFQESPLIRVWTERSKLKQDKSNWNQISGNLKRALQIMDLTPEDFIAGNDELEDMGVLRFEDKKYQISKDKYEFENWFEKRAAEKTWTADDDTKWSLDEWAASNDPERPYISGAGNKTTKEGQVIAQKKSSTAKKASEDQQKHFKIAIKHFGLALDIIAGGQRVGTWFQMPKVKLKFATLKMSPSQIKKAIDCLREIKTEKQLVLVDDFEDIDSELETNEVAEDVIPDLDIAKDVITGKKEKKTYYTKQEDWNDAYLYFMIGLDVGWRATEGLTATYGYGQFWKRDKAVDEKYWTGVWYEKIFEDSDIQVMKIKFLTRKTWGMTDKAGIERTTHTEMILTPDTRIALDQRIKDIKEGIDAIDSGKMTNDEIFKKYGVKATKELDGKIVPNYDHTLIGYDGKYVDINSVKFPTQHKLSKLQKAKKDANKETIRSVKGTKEQAKLHAIMRHCFVASGVDLNATDDQGQVIGDYWLTDTLHSIRHVFAQKWLIQSNWNFSFVAKKGHWGASKILEDAYGGVGDEQQLLDNLNAAAPENSLEKKSEDRKKKLTAKTKEWLESQTGTEQGSGGHI